MHSHGKSAPFCFNRHSSRYLSIRSSYIFSSSHDKAQDIILEVIFVARSQEKIKTKQLVQSYSA